MADNLDRFTKQARQVLQIAQEEAVRLNHNYIGTEHLLLGLAKEEHGIAARVLREVGATPADVVRAVERMAPRSPRPPFGKPALTPRTKRVIELAVEEARQMGTPISAPSTCCWVWCRKPRGLLPRFCAAWA